MRSAVLSWAAFAMADDPLGITTALSAMAGFAAMPFVGGETVGHNAIGPRPYRVLSYGSLFLVGVILGAFAASFGARQFRFETCRRRGAGAWAAGHLIERAAVNIVRN